MPNPVSSILFIETNNTTERIDQLVLLNNQGEVVYSRNISGAERRGDRLEMDMSMYSNGIYFLSLIGEQGQRTERIIKVD